ncbi:MAG: hypothetical protein UHS49_06135 [Faecalimonas sp.]|nr:hypothetical protein [Faecalimonas sp.]
MKKSKVQEFFELQEMDHIEFCRRYLADLTEEEMERFLEANPDFGLEEYEDI